MILLVVGSQPPPARWHASHLICMINRVSSRGALEWINESFPNISTPYLTFQQIGLNSNRRCYSTGTRGKKATKPKMTLVVYLGAELLKQLHRLYNEDVCSISTASPSIWEWPRWSDLFPLPIESAAFDAWQCSGLPTRGSASATVLSSVLVRRVILPSDLCAAVDTIYNLNQPLCYCPCPLAFNKANDCPPSHIPSCSESDYQRCKM